MNRGDWTAHRLAEIEQHLHCCEAEHYGCTKWGISDVRWLINEVKRLRAIADRYFEERRGWRV